VNLHTFSLFALAHGDIAQYYQRTGEGLIGFNERRDAHIVGVEGTTLPEGDLVRGGDRPINAGVNTRRCFHQLGEGRADIVFEVQQRNIGRGWINVKDLAVRVEGDDRITQLAEQGAACQRNGMQHAVAQQTVGNHDEGDEHRDEGEVGGGVDDPGRERQHGGNGDHRGSK